MIEYLRIPKNKFWAWVFTSLALGAIIGAVGVYAVIGMSANKQLDTLKKELAAQSSQSAAVAADLQARLTSTESSLTATTEKYNQLVAKNSAPAPKKSSSTTTSTATLEVLDRSVSDSSVATGDPLTFSAKVQGGPDSVTLTVKNSSTGNKSDFTMTKVKTSGDVTTWRYTRSSGFPTAGTRTFWVTAKKGTKTATMPNASPESFRVR
jgi:hypothetical protein